jgi:hypothetical protein
LGSTTLQLQVQLANLTDVWSPDLHFDHVVFNIYFQTPGATGGLSVMPQLQASVPDGFKWSYGQFTSGYANDNKFFNTTGADATHFGATARGPTVKANGPAKMVTFTYDRNDLGLSTWTGTKVYVATWDYDGVNKAFRPISAAGGSCTYGNGLPTDPYIMDDIAPLTLQGP